MFFDQKAFTTEECRNWCESWLPNFCFHYTFQTSVSSPGSRLGAERWSSAVWFVVRIKVENTSVSLSEVVRETCDSYTFILALPYSILYCGIEKAHWKTVKEIHSLHTHTQKKWFNKIRNLSIKRYQGRIKVSNFNKVLWTLHLHPILIEKFMICQI